MKKLYCISIAAVLCLCLCSCKASDYRKAMTFFESGEYEQALAAFEAADGYKDSAAKIEECKMEILYRDAVALMDAAQYEEAITLLEALDGYRDSVTLIENCNAAILETQYHRAAVLLDSGNIIEAYDSLIALDGYKDSAEKAAAIYTEYEFAKLKEANVGDYVVFGSYEQDNDTSNGKEAIEWIVISKDDATVFVLSKYALECLPYHNNNNKVTWKTCSLREWLNNNFMDTAFSAEEKSIIQKTLHITSENNELTEDNVFLPTPYLIKKYSGNEDVIQCKPTAYADASGTCVSWWLLDDPINLKFLKDSYAKIATDKVGVSGSYHLVLDKYGVRPAMSLIIAS